MIELIIAWLWPILSCFAIEKAVSIFQKRKFNRKFAWALWLIVFFSSSLVGEFCATIGKSYDQRNMSFKEKISVQKKLYNSS